MCVVHVVCGHYYHISHVIHCSVLESMNFQVDMFPIICSQCDVKSDYVGPFVSPISCLVHLHLVLVALY